MKIALSSLFCAFLSFALAAQDAPPSQEKTETPGANQIERKNSPPVNQQGETGEIDTEQMKKDLEEIKRLEKMLSMKLMSFEQKYGMTPKLRITQQEGQSGMRQMPQQGGDSRRIQFRKGQQGESGSGQMRPGNSKDNRRMPPPTEGGEAGEGESADQPPAPKE